MITVTLTL